MRHWQPCLRSLGFTNGFDERNYVYGLVLNMALLKLKLVCSVALYSIAVGSGFSNYNLVIIAICKCQKEDLDAIFLLSVVLVSFIS